MNNILNKYLEHKKITIPVTVIVICLIAGGIVFGVTANSSNKDNATTTASAEIKVGKKSATKNSDTKKSDTKNAAETDEKETASSDEDKSASDSKTTDKKTTTADAGKNTNKASDKSNDSDKKPSSSANGSSSADSNASGGISKSSGGSASKPSGSTGSTTPSKPSGSNSSKPSDSNSNKPSAPAVNYTSCSVCSEKYPMGDIHDCQYTRDYYGNLVRKDSRYVTNVGNYGTKKYSDGTYEVTEEGRNALRQAYDEECQIEGSSSGYWSSRTLDDYVIGHSSI